MSDDDSERRILSRKALAKEQRRAAYQKAKQLRNSDPRYLLMKQQAKEQRRASYQKVKERRKAETDRQKRAKRSQTPDQVRASKLQAKYAKDPAAVPQPSREIRGVAAEPEVVATSVQKLSVWLSKGSNETN